MFFPAAAVCAAVMILSDDFNNLMARERMICIFCFLLKEGWPGLENSNSTDNLVSDILSVFNRAHYLDRCIGSVLRQSTNAWELIAVDDGSDDHTLEILEDYGSKYKNIEVLHHPNMRLPLSRNRGIKFSRGKFITFIDSDDEYEQDHLLKRIEFMKAHPEIDLLHGGVKIIGNQYVRDKNNPSELIHLSECTIGGTFFGKREVFEEMKGFKNLEYSEDSDFLARAAVKFKIGKVDFPTYIYHRDDPTSITNSYVPKEI